MNSECIALEFIFNSFFEYFLILFLHSKIEFKKYYFWTLFLNSAWTKEKHSKNELILNRKSIIFWYSPSIHFLNTRLAFRLNTKTILFLNSKSIQEKNSKKEFRMNTAWIQEKKGKFYIQILNSIWIQNLNQ